MGSERVNATGGPSRGFSSRARTLREAFNTAGKEDEGVIDGIPSRDNGANKAANIVSSITQENRDPFSHPSTNYGEMNSQPSSQQPSIRSRYSLYDTSPSPGVRRYTIDNDISSGSASSGMGDLSDEARKALQTERDRKRLNSLTHRPVDPAHKPSPEPSLNVPTSWGRPKSKATSDWLAGVHNSHENGTGQDHDNNDLFDIGDDFGSSGKNGNSNSDADISPPSMPMSTTPFARPPLNDVRKNRPTTSKIATLTRKPAAQSQSKIPSPPTSVNQSVGLGIRKDSLDPPSESSNGSNSGALSSGTGIAKPKFRSGSQTLLNKLRRNSNPSTQPLPQAQQTPAAQKKADDILYAKTPKVTGAWVDTPAPPARTYEPEIEHSKKEPMAEVKKENAAFGLTQMKSDVKVDKELGKKGVQEQDLEKERGIENLKTRKVKIDETKTREPLRAIDNNATKVPDTATAPKPKLKPILKKPKLPGSALESVIEELKSKDAEDGHSDSTIESLQRLIDDPGAKVEFKPPVIKTEDLNETKVKLEDIEVAQKDHVEETKLEPTQLQKTVSSALVSPDSKAVDQDMDQLNTKIQALVQRIKEAQTGLTSFEKQLAKSSTAMVKQPSSSLVHNDNTYCEHCGRQGDGRIYIAIPIPHLFTRNPRTQRYQLTRLGWISVGLSVYLYTEYLLSIYLYPRHSLDCDRGICIYPDAPRFPIISLTLLWRLSGLGYLMYVFWPLKITCVFLFRFFLHAFGFWNGSVGTSHESGTGTSSASTVTQAHTPGTSATGFFSGLVSGLPGSLRWGTHEDEIVQPREEQGFRSYQSDVFGDADLRMMQDEFLM